jgi:hypothetical protein
MTATTAPRARGAMLLLFDVAPDAIAEHDDWHTHEHMPERLAIPGFLRGTRWTRGSPEVPAAPGPRYCVVYEVSELAVLDSPAYRARLEAPTPWTAKMMACYAGMRRTLCEVVAGEGDGVGGACLLVTLAPAPGAPAGLGQRLAQDVLAGLADRRGIVSWRLLANALPAPMTREQAIRGRDDAVDSALWVTGYDTAALAALETGELDAARLEAYGAGAVTHATYALANLIVSPCTRRGAGGRARSRERR